MVALTIRLPDSLHNKIKELAREDGVSINQFLASAAAEKVSALLTVDFLKEQAKNGDRKRFEAVLKKVPGNAPDPGDEIL